MLRFLSMMVAVYAAIVLTGAGTSPQSTGTKHDQKNLVTVSVLPQLSVASDAATCVVVRFKIEHGWHLYWSNPGDSGMATKVTMTLPTGWAQGSPTFPRPQILGSAEERTYGYENEFDLLIPINSSIDPRPATVSVSVNAEWLVCKGVCFMGSATATVEVETRTLAAIDPTLKRAYPTALPREIRAALEGSAAQGVLVVEGASSVFGESPVQFVPDPMAGVEFMDGTGPFMSLQSGDKAIMRVPFKIEPKDAVDGPPRIKGLVLTGRRESDPVYRIDLAPQDVPAAKK